MSANNNPVPKMYTGDIDDDKDPSYYYGNNFNRLFHTDKRFLIGVIAVVSVGGFLLYAGFAAVEVLYLDNRSIDFGGLIDQIVDTYWDIGNKPLASIFGVNSAT